MLESRNLTEILMAAHPRLTALDEEEQHQEQVYGFYLTFFIMMLFFFITGAMIEKFKPRYGHETCLTLILGIIISLILWAIHPVKNTTVFQFKSGFFFNFFLPPIVFNSGFNMRKKKFFANLGNVALFGLVVTLVCFVIYSALTYSAVNYFGLMMTDYYD